MLKIPQYQLAPYLPYFLVQKLIEWHFDIYGNIDKKLALDINLM